MTKESSTNRADIPRITTDLSSNKLEWAVTQSFGSCTHCHMDISLLAPTPSPQVTGSRVSIDRRGSRSSPMELVDLYVSCFAAISSIRSDINSTDKAALISLANAKLGPFRQTNLGAGIYADDNDPLGRVWYHIPNLGARVCRIS
jgi:hypothetical protein